MSNQKRIIDVEEWNQLYKKLTDGLNQYDHYCTGYVDAVDIIDDWMDAHRIVDTEDCLAGQYRWERNVAIDQLEQLGIGFGQKIDGVYLTKEEYEKLLEYKHMYEDLCK